MASSKSKYQRYQLPKGHLSWSQVDLVERDPIEYARSYILGEPRYESEAMMFGKEFADAMKDGVPPPDANDRMKFLVSIGMPRLEMPEHPMKAEYHGIKLVGILDSCGHDYKTFREYKTGRSPWTQGRVNSHGQLSFYAALIWLNHRIMPQAYLDWVRTSIDENGDISPAGDIQTFVREPFNMLDILHILHRAEKAAETITGLVKEYKSIQK